MSLFVPATENPEGWAYTPTGSKAHYFRNRRPLCHAKARYNGMALAGDTTVSNDEKCAKCWDARHAEIVKAPR